MLPEGVTSLRTEQVPKFNPTGPASAVYRVTFMVGQDGPFVEEFSQAEHTPEGVRERIRRVVSIVTSNRE